MTTPPDDTTEGKALPETMLQPCSFDDSPELTTAPVTAEDLRERIARLMTTAPWPGKRAYDKADAVLHLLAGVPGDLPARMEAAIAGCTRTAGETYESLTRRLAAAAVSVRWEHAARQAAEVERLRAELAGARFEVTQWAERARAALGEVERVRSFADAITDQRDALKAAIEKLSARHQPKQATQWIRCRRHAKALSTDVALFLRCTNCRKEPVTVCSNLTCCEYPCEDRRAIDAALAVPESTESRCRNHPTQPCACPDDQWDHAPETTPDAPIEGEPK